MTTHSERYSGQSPMAAELVLLIYFAQATTQVLVAGHCIEDAHAGNVGAVNFTRGGYDF